MVSTAAFCSATSKIEGQESHYVSVICIFLPFRRLVATFVPKITVHHLTHGQSIYAGLACVSNILSTLLKSACRQQSPVK